MAFINNVMIVRQRLLAELVRMWKEDQLTERIDRLPIEFSPRTAHPKGRCCIHKERAVWKYKSFPLLGFDMSDEKDELTPLSDYARRATEGRDTLKDNILCVIDEACSACVKNNYVISEPLPRLRGAQLHDELPQGRHRDRSRRQGAHQPRQVRELRHLPQQPPLPCGALHSGAVRGGMPRGRHQQGRARHRAHRRNEVHLLRPLLNSCPFGAIFEISQVFDVLSGIRRGEKTVAIVAPAILGQYAANIDEVYGAIRAIGFTDVIEVAQGAMETIENEGAELVEKLEEGQEVHDHLSAALPHRAVGEARTRDQTLYFVHRIAHVLPPARIAQEEVPRREDRLCRPLHRQAQGGPPRRVRGLRDDFRGDRPWYSRGMGIEIGRAESYGVPFVSTRSAHGFAQERRRAGAVKLRLAGTREVNGVQIAGLNRKKASPC